MLQRLGTTSTEPVAYGQSKFGQSLHPPLLTETQCTGSEASLLECQYSNETDSCDHTSAGIRCKGVRGICEEAGHLGCCEQFCFVSGCFCDATCYNLGDCCPDISNICPLPSGKSVSPTELILRYSTLLLFLIAECATGEIQLVGGADQTQGRVELCVEGRWSSVCGKQWGNSESFVVCSQLGLVQAGIHVC